MTTNKYQRRILANELGFSDVYDVLIAFEVTCPARQHAIKKLLMAGRRGKNDTQSDLYEAIDAIARAIEIDKLKPKELTK